MRDLDLFGVIGNPISHSKSPEIHNKWFKQNSLNAFYTPLWVKSEADLSDMLPKLPKLGFRGVNITVPYKQTALEIIKNEGGFLSVDAEKIGAVNVVKFADNTIYGFNTDWIGFMQAIKPHKQPQKALVLGAGGSSRAILYGLLQDGVEVYLTNRTLERLEDIEFSGINKLKWNEIDDILSKVDLIVNATSVGLKDEILEINYNLLKSSQVCFDLIYKNTPFLQKANNKGCMTVNGFEMLINQARESFKIWLGFEPDK